MRLTSEIRTVLPFGLAILLLTVLTVLSFRSIQRLLDHNRRVAHTGEVIAAVNELLALALDAATGQRGYIITGQERFLEIHRREAEAGARRTLTLVLATLLFGTALLAVSAFPFRRELRLRMHAESAAQAAIEELRELSLTDGLTGLSNRRGFMLLADRLRTTLVEHNHAADRPYVLALSVGVAEGSVAGHPSLVDLPARADEGMYHRRISAGRSTASRRSDSARSRRARGSPVPWNRAANAGYPQN